MKEKKICLFAANLVFLHLFRFLRQSTVDSSRRVPLFFSLTHVPYLSIMCMCGAIAYEHNWLLVRANVLVFILFFFPSSFSAKWKKKRIAVSLVHDADEAGLSFQ